MSNDGLRILVVLDALVIVGYAIVAWGAEVSPLALTIAVVAAMVTQIAVVVRPGRAAPVPPPPPAGGTTDVA